MPRTNRRDGAFDACQLLVAARSAWATAVDISKVGNKVSQDGS
jgi:hypothetical protein